MNLKDARRLKPGDRIVAGITDEGLLGFKEGDIFLVVSNDSCVGRSKDAKWLTFGPSLSKGNRGLSCYAMADLFDLAPGA